MLFKVASMASHSTSISLSSCWKRVSEEVLWPGLTRVCAASWWLSPCPKRRMDWMEEVWKMNMWGSTEAACWEAQMSAPQKPQLRKRLCYIKLQSLMAVWMEGNICQSSTYWRLMKLDKSKFGQFFVVIPIFLFLCVFCSSCCCFCCRYPGGVDLEPCGYFPYHGLHRDAVYSETGSGSCQWSSAYFWKEENTILGQMLRISRLRLTG